MARKAKTKAVTKTKTTAVRKKNSVKAIPMTKSIAQIRSACIAYGDHNQSEFLTTSDSETKEKAGKNAMTGYKQAIDAFKVQLIYKKMTGCTKRVSFGEE
tara:strand:+ start:127 stop:426 length:300 start_codon:yes stop_codon:yes gene_type:complete